MHLKKMFVSLFLTFAVSIAILSSASAEELVPVKLNSPQPPLGTMAALHFQKASERKVPKYISQAQIDKNMKEQELQDQQDQQRQEVTIQEGFGIVTTKLAGQTRSVTMATVIPTVYNYSAETIKNFYGLVDFYRETGDGTGQYAYQITASARGTNIPPTLTTGWALNTISYPHYGWRTYWEFYGTYEVPGSSVITLKESYANF